MICFEASGGAGPVSKVLRSTSRTCGAMVNEFGEDIVIESLARR
jgi:hypothetical protein